MAGRQSVGITVNRFRFTFHNDKDSGSGFKARRSEPIDRQWAEMKGAVAKK